MRKKLNEELVEEGGELAEGATVALCLFAAGLMFLLLGGSDVTTESLLYRHFGAEGAGRVTRAIGALGTLAGGLWFVRCMCRLWSLRQRR